MDTSEDVAASTTNHHTTVGDFATASGDAYEAWDESEDERLSTAVSSTEGFSEGLATTARDVKKSRARASSGPENSSEETSSSGPEAGHEKNASDTGQQTE
ncbi:hypothetical protein GN244_ATG08422 [Phytophthora infestans]|uniref:Uncharacterized protein n=1 Tax=Phytophthora infestans TaxID=4787 RepID=A0A833S384_PHYIN|nr:hypothetical protein GN244_ATG08422 [Phytophthora infestans]